MGFHENQLNTAKSDWGTFDNGENKCDWQDVAQKGLYKVLAAFVNLLAWQIFTHLQCHSEGCKELMADKIVEKG